MRIVIVTKKTPYRKIIEEFHTESAAEFDLKMKGSSINSYKAENEVYERSIAQIKKSIPNSITLTQVEREDLSRFSFFDTDLIVACGPDGLLINLAQYITVQKVITINPDASRVKGVTMLFKPEDLANLIKKDDHACYKLTIAKAVVNDDPKKVVYGLGDIFFGRNDQSSAFYNIQMDGMEADQISSGVIVTTGTGSSGWFKSITHMIASMSGSYSRIGSLDLWSKDLRFVVRELFSSTNKGVDYGIIGKSPLIIRSTMPSGGIVFSDGMIDKGLPLLAGDIVSISQAERTLSLVRG